MSGIAGIVRFNDEPVKRQELERVANTLRQYGPDRSNIIVSDRIGFVHTLMRMTPEDRIDKQPQQGSSGVLITADLRLDNRDELIARFGIDRREASEWSDSRLLLTCWEEIGDGIWPILRGPFAVAIWDPRKHSLTLARDHLGLNVVMWHRSDRFFAFASMPKGLFALDDVPRKYCEEKLADFLVLNHADLATTIYRNVYRVPPAHTLQISSNGSLKLNRYWSPTESKPFKLASDVAYAEGLRECLDRAVRRQMRSMHPIGCLLTGGLDSSSVSVLAARALNEKSQRLVTFTGVPSRNFTGRVPDGCYADEMPFVKAIQKAAGNIDAEYVYNDGRHDFAGLERFFVAMDGPVRNPTNLGWVLAVLERARSQGRRVLLGGLYGNHTISWNGWSQTATHFLHGRLFLAYRQWQQFYRSTPYSRWVALRKLLFEPIIPTRLGDWVDRHRHPTRTAPWQDHAPIRGDFAAAMSVASRAKKVGHDFLYRNRRDERTNALTQVDYIGDWHAAEKAVSGVEVRDPTADIDVLSYCLGVPPEQYLAEGIDRSLIRRAMWGLLPECVLTNRLSGLQAPDWYEKIEGQRGEIAREIAELSKSPLACKAIDLTRLETAVQNWPDGDWHSPAVFREYNLALTRGVANGRFFRWLESKN